MLATLKLWSPGRIQNGLLILDREDAKVRYEPKSKNGVHGKNWQIYMLSEGISYNYLESAHKKTICPIHRLLVCRKFLTNNDIF